MSADPTTRGERIPHLMIGLVRRVEADDPDDVDYRVDTACGLDRNITLVTSDRAQVRCPACRATMPDAEGQAALRLFNVPDDVIQAVTA